MTRFTDNYLLALLAQASASASAGFHAELDTLGVSVATWRILATLYPDAPASIGELASSCMTKQPTMTRQIERLHAAGLVTRHPTKTDRRRVMVQLSDQGGALAEQLTERARAHEQQVLKPYDTTQITALKSILRGMLAS